MLRHLHNGGSLDDIQPGLDFFKKVNDAGNFVPVIAKVGTIAQGATPIVLAWDYNAFGDKDSLAGNPPLEVVYPNPTIASMYVQAISAYAPHPNCAKVWMEIIHSDEGQLAWMKGYAHGVHQADMEARGVIPADLKAKLPASSAYASAVSPSPDQLTVAKEAIKTGWDATVGVEVQNNQVVTVSQATIKQDAPKARPALPKLPLAWLGVMPFFVFAFLFLLYPSSTIVVRTFQDSETGEFTFRNIVNLLLSPYVMGAYWMSIKISVVTALGGGIFGFLLAYSSIRGGLPRFMRTSLMTFSGVASNFAGIPLAFAFIALLSPTGMLTGWLKAVGYKHIRLWFYALQVLGIKFGVYVFPVPAHGVDHYPRD